MPPDRRMPERGAVTLALYTLRVLGPIHLGTGRPGDLGEVEKFPRSDTLAAALVSLWGHVTNASASEVTSIAAEPPFAVSSAMPVLADGEPLLPLPVGLGERLAQGVPEVRKELRRTRFARAATIRKAVVEGDFAGARAQLRDTEREVAASMGEESRTRLAVDRLGGGPIEGLLFDFGTVRLRDGARLGVVADLGDGSARAPFEAALRLLGDCGIGGDRSVGCGAFEVESVSKFDPRLGEGARLVLSLLHPTPREIGEGLLDDPASYRLVPRGGWLTVPGAASLRRKRVNMLEEGSMVRDLGVRSYGDSPRVLDALPELGLTHPVHRPGRAVTVPIRAWRDE